MSRFCENCGAPLAGDSVFCEKCGARVGSGGGSMQAPGRVQPGQAAGGYPQQGGYPRQGGYPSQGGYPQQGGYPPQGAYPPQGGGRKKGSPIVPILIVLLLIAAGAGAFFFLKNRSGDDADGAKDSGKKIEAAAEKDEKKASAKSGKGGGKADEKEKDAEKDPGKDADKDSGKEEGAGAEGSGTASGEAEPASEASSEAASEAAPEGEGAPGIEIPDGASVRTDAVYTDIIGEYEGEIGLTEMEGFESIEGAPANLEELRKDALSRPLPTELEIEEDGEWNFKMDFMGSMRFSSRDLRMDEPTTAEEMTAHLMKAPVNGRFAANVKMTEGSDSGGVLLDNLYCEDSEGGLIAGRMEVTLSMGGSNVTMAGNYVLRKMTEDFVPEETEETEPGTEEETEPETEEETEPETEKETEPETEPEEIETVTGGDWTKTSGGKWIYEKNGKIIRNSWVESDGVYYFVDDDGYMLKNSYTPDGFYVGNDGSYNPKAPENSGGAGKTSSGSSNLPDGLDSYDPSTFAVTGGEWDKLQDGSWMYTDAKGEYVKNVWVRDGGDCYFIGPDGCMVKDNYATDGFYADGSGKWDRSIPQRDADPEPMDGTYKSGSAQWTISLKKSGLVYAEAVKSYTGIGGYTETFELLPVGHGVYIGERNENSPEKTMFVFSEDRRMLVVSGAGITDRFQMK